MRVGQLKQFLEDMDENLEVCIAGSDDVAELYTTVTANLTYDFGNNGKKTIVLIYQE